MKPNCSTANRTSVRPTSSPRSPRSAAASRGSETLCRASLPTAEASTAACAAPAKWCADSTQCAPAAVNHSPTAGDATRASAASTNASTGAAVQTPTPAAADVAPAVRSTSGNEPFAAPARPSAIDGAAAKKPAAADVAPAARTTSGNEPSATSARPFATLCATTKKPAAADVAPAPRTTSGNGPSAAPARPSATADAAAKKPAAATGALSAERRAAAVAAGVVLRSADDRTALFTQWLAPHLPMVRGLVRRHTYFAGERADDYQTAVLHLLEHLDDLAHFALCLTARRDTTKPRAATANDTAQSTTPVARDFDETCAEIDESELFPDEHAPYLYAAEAESNESQCGGDEALRAIDAAAVAFDAPTDADDEALREANETQREVDETRPSAEEALCAIDTATVPFDAMTDADDEALREVDETPPTDDEALRAIDAAAVGFDAMTDADDEALREMNETRREVDETQPADDETAADDEASAAANDERQPYADAALEGAEQTPAPLPVTAEEVLRTVEPFNPRPWLAGVTLRLLSTLNHRALRHRETHLTPASADSDELFDPVDPDGGLWAVGADSTTAGAQRNAVPSRWEETLGAGRERTGGSAGVSTRDAAATRAAQAEAAHSATAVSHSATADSDAQAAAAHSATAVSHSATADSDAQSAGAEEAAAAEGEPTAAGEGACSAVDNCLECWHREQPRRGFHRTRGGRLWNAMRARAQQAHSAFAYRAVLRADAAEALAAQPLRDRALVLLTADGWTAEEIGLAVGASPTAVRQTVCRVRTRLRRWRRAWAHRTHATRAL